MTKIGILLVALVGLGATAWAQDFEAAGKHFSAAQEAFGAKHFKTAATEFESAYGITKDPVLLYNIAESWEKAGDGHKAVANYKSYLKEQPNAQDRAEVQKRISAIEAKHYRLVDQSTPGDNTTTAPATPTPPPPPATPPPTVTGPAGTTRPTPPPGLKEPGPTTTPPPSTSAAPPSTAPTTPPSTAPTTTETTPPTTPPPVVPTPESTANTNAPPPAAVAPPPAAPPQEVGLVEEGPMSGLRKAAWVGVAVTLSVLTAGAIFGLAAESRADDINRRLSFVDMNNQPHKYDQSTDADLKQLKDDGNLYNGLAIGFYAAAGACAIATVTMFVVDAKRGKPEKQHAWRLSPVVGKNAGGFALGGSF